MTILRLTMFAIAVLIAIELSARLVMVLLNRMLRQPVVDPGRFFADQTRMIEVLINSTDRRDVVHPTLGWACRRGHAAAGDPISAQGLRTTRTYAPEPDDGVARIAAFGDSYVYCNEVAVDAGWPSVIEKEWGAEVLNYGVGGYGVDQAFLRFGEEPSLRPSVVLIGITTMMVPRTVSRYRRFQDSRDGPWFKPRFLADAEWRLLPPPMPDRAAAERLLQDPRSAVTLGDGDEWYSPTIFESPLYRWSHAFRIVHYVAERVARRRDPRRAIFRGQTLNPESEAFRLTVKVVARFADAIRAAGATPVVALFPARSDVEAYQQQGFAPYHTVRAEIERQGLQVVDLAPVLADAGKPLDDLYMPGGHCSPVGNVMVAHALADALGLARRTNPV